MVIGNIDFDENAMLYQDFLNQIFNCIDSFSSTNEQPDEANMNLSPNPTSDFLNVSIESNNRFNYLFDIVDINGKVVLYDILINSSFSSIDLSSIASGVYFLRSKNTDEVAAQMFIKL